MKYSEIPAIKSKAQYDVPQDFFDKYYNIYLLKVYNGGYSKGNVFIKCPAWRAFEIEYRRRKEWIVTAIEKAPVDSEIDSLPTSNKIEMKLGKTKKTFEPLSEFSDDEKTSKPKKKKDNESDEVVESE
jgi:hypothetical protein